MSARRCGVAVGTTLLIALLIIFFAQIWITEKILEVMTKLEWQKKDQMESRVIAAVASSSLVAVCLIAVMVHEIFNQTGIAFPFWPPPRCQASSQPAPGRSLKRPTSHTLTASCTPSLPNPHSRSTLLPDTPPARSASRRDSEHVHDFPSHASGFVRTVKTRPVMVMQPTGRNRLSGVRISSPISLSSANWCFFYTAMMRCINARLDISSSRSHSFKTANPVLRVFFGIERRETLSSMAFNMNCNLKFARELEQLLTSPTRDDIPPVKQIIARRSRRSSNSSMCRSISKVFG